MSRKEPPLPPAAHGPTPGSGVPKEPASPGAREDAAAAAQGAGEAPFEPAARAAAKQDDRARRAEDAAKALR